MRLYVKPILIIHEGDETDYNYILYSNVTGLAHPIAVLLRQELSDLVDSAESALGVVEERILNAKRNS